MKADARDGAPDGEAIATTLISMIERFLAAAPGEERTAFRPLLSELRALAAAGRTGALAKALRMTLVPTLDFTSARSLQQLYTALPPEAKSGARIRIAILGGFTTNQLRDLIELFLFAAGIDAEIYEADYDVFRQEMLDPGSGLSAFGPDLVYLATHWRNLGHRPDLRASVDEVRAAVAAEYDDWALLWRTAHERLNCQIVQNGFDTPPWRALGNDEMRHPATLSRFIADLNRLMVDTAPGYVTIHDVDALSAQAGRRAWANDRFFFHAKLPCAPEYLVDYAHSVASVVAAQRGLAKKCLVLDLDNTLWGGVIGDDGMRGIRIGQGDAEGEAFAAFQSYARMLASRGVILAVCSKNTDAVAREVFDTHPDMVLRAHDIACFVANWEDKASNLRAIARTLDIGLDALVFVDDNPAERSIIRQLVPEVSVPEVSADPSDFIEALERHRYFQVVTLGAEDFKRGEYYRANAARAEMASAAGDLSGFLQTLDMTSQAGPIVAATLERSAQLINKSNQFNLTTRRKSAAEVMAAQVAPDWVTLTATLSDRFGDNGLISVLLARIERDTLAIDTWVMSCRVLKRGMERFLLNVLVDEARVRGVRSIRGEYIPTAKNGLVRDHFEDLGFARIEADADGRTVWQLDVATAASLPTSIKRIET